MAVKFKRSKKIAPGVKVNLNKKSASVTIGNQYGRVTTGTSGRMTKSTSIPGTGVYFSSSKTPKSKKMLEAAEEKSECFDLVLDRDVIKSLNRKAFLEYKKAFLEYASSAGKDAENIDEIYKTVRFLDEETESRSKKQTKKVGIVVVSIFAMLGCAFLLSAAFAKIGLPQTLGCAAIGAACLVGAYKCACIADII